MTHTILSSLLVLSWWQVQKRYLFVTSCELLWTTSPCVICFNPHENSQIIKKCCLSVPVTAQDVINTDNNPDLQENSYMFTKNVRGSAACWKNKLLDLLATIRSLGPPTLFMTLSADDMHWPELIMTSKGCSYEEAIKQRSAANLVKNDPLLIAIHFERRVKALLKFVINSAG